MDTLGEAVIRLRDGVTALKAENCELRLENDRIRTRRRASAEAEGRLTRDVHTEVRLPLDARAPGAARMVVERFLCDRVPASILEEALLVVSELVTNGVRHGGALPGDVLVFRVGLARTRLRLEVEDPGRGGVVARRAADVRTGTGFGLNVVQTLSERWGTDRAPEGGTRVWAQLRAPIREIPATA
jgi:anti-sigma regulatory factor (Ser/Thr protein kinase)